jgi:hypothetical protein
MYSFLVTEPGDYYILVSIKNLVDTCDNLTFTEGENFLPILLTQYDNSGVADILVQSVDISVVIGDETMLNCDLSCD